MKDTFKQLNEAELKTLFKRLKSHFDTSNVQEYAAIRKHVQKYYPNTAVSAVLEVDSEYNDCTYDNSVRYLGVYDEHGEELLPLKEKAKEARAEWRHFNVNDGNETSEPMEDIIVRINDTLPTIFVRE